MATTPLSAGPTLNTPGLQHDVPGGVFLALLGLLGAVWFILPLSDRDRWLLAGALILGAVYWAETIAAKEGIPSPVTQITRGLG
jgi:hypothetical protein